MRDDVQQLLDMGHTEVHEIRELIEQWSADDWRSAMVSA
jgi:hypothetical protein